MVNVFKGLGVIDSKNTEKAFPCPHVLIPHGAVLLLTCSVQDVQETRLSINYYLFSVRVLDKKYISNDQKSESGKQKQKIAKKTFC